MKRIISVVVSIALVLSMCLVPADAVETIDAVLPTVMVESKSEPVKPGEPVTLAVTIANNPGFTNFEWNIDYNANQLQLTAINTSFRAEVYGEMREVDYISNANVVPNVETSFITCAKATALTNTGTIFTLTFVVKEGAAAGKAAVTIISDKFENAENAEKAIAATYVPGGVTIAHTCGNGSLVQGQAASCTEDGWNDYYMCACGKTYVDEACETEIVDLEAWKTGEGKIAADHNYGDWKMDAEKHWKECTCDLKSEEGSHKYDDDADTSCEVCGYIRTVDDGTTDDGTGGNTTGGSTTGGSTTGGSTTGGSTTGGSTTGGSTTGGSTTGGSTTGGSTTGGSTTGGSTTGGSTTGGSTTGGSTTGGSTTGGSTTGGSTTGGSTTGGNTTGGDTTTDPPKINNMTNVDDSILFDFDEDSKTLTVTNDAACVVLVKDVNGNYTKLTYISNLGNNYAFDVSTIKEGEELVIALKGDADLDGEVSFFDATTVLYAYVDGIDLGEFIGLVADMDNNMTVDFFDATSILYAYVDNNAIPW